LNMSSVERFWWEIITAILGGLYLYIGLVGTSAWDLIRTIGVLGGLLMIGSIACGNTWRLLLLIFVGAIPLAIVAWWSLIAPIVAVASIVVAFLRIGRIRTTHRRLLTRPQGGVRS